VSTYVRAPWCAAAAAIASSSATRPSALWTELNATRSCCAPSASASRSTGTSSTRTPRASWARNGNRTLVKSSSAHSTLAPAGSAAAISPVKTETAGPTATSAAGTPAIRAKLSRPAATERSQPSKLVRPWRHSSAAAWSASNAVRGGNP
jgi:hypothetical protein